MRNTTCVGFAGMRKSRAEQDWDGPHLPERPATNLRSVPGFAQMGTVPWYVVHFDKESIEPFQLFVVGKVFNPFSHDRRQLEWLQNAILANREQSVQPYLANPTVRFNRVFKPWGQNGSESSLSIVRKLDPSGCSATSTAM
jgi:hypothetical protein